MRPSCLAVLLALSATLSASVSRAAAPSGWTPAFAFGIEPGVNSMVSIAGAHISYYPTDRFAIDAGIGFGMANTKYGVRGRVFFLDWKKLHPYAGVSYAHATGWGNHSLSMGLDVTRNGEARHYDFDMVVGPTDFLGFQGGVEFRFGHFILRPGLGWSQQLGGRNWKVVGGEGPEGEDKKAIDFLEGSGPIACIGAGFGF